jgi:hypothetical protein
MQIFLIGIDIGTAAFAEIEEEWRVITVGQTHRRLPFLV